MSTIAIVTDSTSDLDPAIAAEQNITLVPAHVRFGDIDYKDGVDIKGDEFYAMLLEAKDLPQTSQPSAGEFVEVYQRLAQDHDEIVSLHVSGKLSGTMQSALTATQEMQGKTDCKIHVVDTQSVSLGLAYVAREAARLAADGVEADRIVNHAKYIADLMHVAFTPETLEYLHRGGRLGAASHLIGSLLRVKPILTLKDGAIDVLDKVRTRSRVIERMVKHVESVAGEGGTVTHLGIMHANAPDFAAEMQQAILDRVSAQSVVNGTIGPAIGTHAGPGAVGVTFHKE
jgi:DegV family protein with EDD domain